MAHWRAFFTSKDYLTAADLYDEASDTFKDLDVQIERVIRVTLKGEKGREDQRPGVYFRGHRKPLGANATNCDSISLALGSYDMKRWPGGWVSLYVDENVEVKERGRTVKRPAVRIRMKSPRAHQQQDSRTSSSPQQQRQPQQQQQRSSAPQSTPPATSSRQPPPDLFDNVPPPIDPDEAAEIARLEREQAQKDRR